MTVYKNSLTKYTEEYIDLTFAKAKLILQQGYQEDSEDNYILLTYNDYISILSTLGIALGKCKDNPNEYFAAFLSVEKMIEALEESLEASEREQLH